MSFAHEYENFLKVYQTNYKIDMIGFYGSLSGY